MALNDNVLPTDSDKLDKIQPGYLGILPSPNLPPEKGLRAWVDRPEQLLSAVNILKQSVIVAIDAEFTQTRSIFSSSSRNMYSQQSNQGSPQAENLPFPHRLALLQLAVEGQCFVVDALHLNDLSPLKAVIEQPNITVLLHGAGADMRVMADRDLNVAHYLDLEATSRSIYGQQESSLAAMLQRAVHIKLDKSLQRTDWTRRPLPPAMVAYAARDAEMTLALYHWLNQHYAWALKLHEYMAGEEDTVAAWIEPYLFGASASSPDIVMAEAKARGIFRDEDQAIEDCRAALATLRHPMHRSRLLRLITDLMLVQLAPDIEPLLQASSSEERSASARSLGRLGIKEARESILSLLSDPVFDVRKAAQTALRSLSGTKEPRPPSLPSKLVDGARSWTVGETADAADDNSDWKARLRAMMGDQ